MQVLFNNRPYEIAYRPGSSDEIVIHEAGDDIYRFADLVDSGQAWIDAGANIGTSMLSILAHGGNVLIGLEPDQQNYRLCRDNLYRAGYVEVHIANTGLLPPGRWRLDTNGEPWNYKMVPADEDDLVIQGVSLSQLVRLHRRPCLKMDIEGLEQDIIMNIPLEDLSRLEIIVMEYHHDRHTTAEYLRLLERLRLAGFHFDAQTITEAHKSLQTPYILTAINGRSPKY
jgi:FkbM family methyltransferase